MSKTRKPPLRLVFDMIVPPGSTLRSELTRQHRLQPPFAEYDGHAAKDMDQL
jgi:hypothetical protein